MKLEPVLQKLVDDGLGVAGQDLFVHRMPDTVTVGALLLSKLSGTPIDHELPGYRKTSFQVIVRHTDYVQGEQLAEQISSALTIRNAQVGSLKVKYIQPMHEPVIFPISEGDHLEISVNYDAVYVQT